MEAKLSPEAFDPTGMLGFRALHPQGTNFLACPFVKESYTISKSGLKIRVCTPDRIS